MPLAIAHKSSVPSALDQWLALINWLFADVKPRDLKCVTKWGCPPILPSPPWEEHGLVGTLTPDQPLDPGSQASWPASSRISAYCCSPLFVLQQHWGGAQSRECDCNNNQDISHRLWDQARGNNEQTVREGLKKIPGFCVHQTSPWNSPTVT